jgi:hypothetical protein
MLLSFHWNKSKLKLLQIFVPNFRGPFKNHKLELLKFIIKLYILN